MVSNIIFRHLQSAVEDSIKDLNGAIEGRFINIHSRKGMLFGLVYWYEIDNGRPWYIIFKLLA